MASIIFGVSSSSFLMGMKLSPSSLRRFGVLGGLSLNRFSVRGGYSRASQTGPKNCRSRPMSLAAPLPLRVFGQYSQRSWRNGPMGVLLGSGSRLMVSAAEYCFRYSSASLALVVFNDRWIRLRPTL